MERERRILAWLRGGEPESDGTDPYDETALALLEMGRLAAKRLDASRVAAFRSALETEVKRQSFGDHLVYHEWLRLAEIGPEAVGRMLLDETERGRYMRAMAPLRAFINRRERLDILHAIARERSLERLKSFKLERER